MPDSTPAVAIAPTLSRRERKRQSTRQAIFDTAIRMFSEQGFNAPTIDQIAAVADVGKGTFYNYFASKEDLLVAFMLDLEIRGKVRLARIAGAQGSLEAILRRYERSELRLKQSNFAFVQVFLSTLIRHGPQMSAHIVKMQEYADPPLHTLFSRLKERGLIEPSVDVRVLVHTFKCIQLGVSCLWAITGPSTESALVAFDAQLGPFVRSIERKVL